MLAAPKQNPLTHTHRNPLLHFPEALYRHATHDLGLPVLLLLNKCDLIPDKAAAAWKEWLEARHPGLAVLTVSAAKGGGAARTQREVLQALLEARVAGDEGGGCSSGGSEISGSRERGRQRVGDIIGLSMGESRVVLGAAGRAGNQRTCCPVWYTMHRPWPPHVCCCVESVAEDPIPLPARLSPLVLRR
jgi:hypothetical protein